MLSHPIQARKELAGTYQLCDRHVEQSETSRRRVVGCRCSHYDGASFGVGELA